MQFKRSRRSFAIPLSTVLFVVSTVIAAWFAWTSYGDAPSARHPVSTFTSTGWLNMLALLTVSPLQKAQMPTISRAALELAQLSLAEMSVASQPTTSILRSTTGTTKNVDWNAWIKSLSSQTKARRLTIGWTLDTGTKNIEQVLAVTPGLDVLAPKWLHVDGLGGALTNTMEPDIVKYAHRRGVKVWAVVDNGFNAGLSHAILRYRDQQDALIRRVVQIAVTNHIDGINLDFEGLSSQDRWNFSRFVRVLGAKLHARGLSLSVDLPPDIVSGDNAGPYDHKAISAIADEVIVMGYDEYWGGDANAGPTASLPWVRSAVTDMLVTGVPRAKLVLGVPFYTQDWALSPSGSVLASNALSIVQTGNLLAKRRLRTAWNRRLGVHYVAFTENRVRHEIWLEDNRSLLLTLQLIAKDHLSGAAAWYLGLEQPSTWSSFVMAVHSILA